MAAPNAATTPTTSSVNPCHTCDTRVRPIRARIKPHHTAERTGSPSPNLNHSATMIGAVNSMSSATPTGRRAIDTKYSHCVIAMPRIP